MRRPRVKPEHRAYRTVDGHVRIGSVVHGIGAEVKDPDGWVWTLVEAMDGTRTGADVVAEVSRRHPHLRLPAEDILQAMTDLTAAGYVEDAGAVPPPELSERERERYGRGMTLMRWMDLQPRQNPWEPQLRLRRARVLLVGVGGTGGAAARDLVASGVGRLHCVEPDVVELSNLNRQTLYREQDLGTPKIDAALRALRALNPHTTVTGERREVRGPADLEDLLTGTHGNLGPATSGNLGPATSGNLATAASGNLGPATADGFGRSASGRPASGGSGTSVRGGSVAGPRYDVLLLAADRPAAIRRWANQVCLATGTPWAEAGYRGPLVSVGMFRPGRSACWVCLRDAEAERRDLRLAPGQDEDVASPRMPWNPVNAVTAGLSGSLLAHAALALLCDVPRMDAGCRFGLNLMMPGDPVMQRTPRRPHCPACGTKPSTKRAVPAPEPAAPAPEPAVPAADSDTTAPVPEPAVPAAEPAAPAPDPNTTAPVPEPAVPAADSDTTAPAPDTTAPAPDTTAPAPASAPPPPSGGASS